ncbi:hypothetical protein [Tritonibacter mobilis]|uniref:hypothetical protein n=1 Tax=Tritonibacter mobilis TaxID=379347 RepID=UPI001CDA1556|nr:hypothetical protein [Tritonibacter mobilis]MCA2008847.1 hypothetical protein [Tritonibacter mobilis]
MAKPHFIHRIVGILRTLRWRRVKRASAKWTPDTPQVRHQLFSAPVCPTGRITGQSAGVITLAGRRIQYAVDIGFETTPEGTPHHAGVRGWALDLDRFEPAGTLCLTAQSGHREHLLPDQPRGDALSAVRVPEPKRKQALLCGFSGYLSDAGEKVTLELELDGSRHKIGIGHPHPPQILKGHNGWLFLAGDSNDSPRQFTGDHSPSEGWKRSWDCYTRALERLRDSGSGGKICFVIAPSKESLFPDYYPLPRGTQTPLDSLMARHGTLPELYYPVDVLAPVRELSYDPVETHWTDFGARMVCQEIMHKMDGHNPSLPLQFRMPYVSGDLGWKSVPPLRTYRPTASWPNPSTVIFDNYVLHHGRIRIHSNPKAPRKQTYLLFGGSSAEHMERYLSAIFARVVYVYSAGSWDPAILEHERPAFTILQSSERFLTRAPEPEIDVSRIVANKLSEGRVTKNGVRQELMAEWNDSSVAFYLEMG